MCALLHQRKVTIHGLCNNAGCFQVAGFTEDGYQTVFQVNYLAHVVMTHLLEPLLSSDARVVNVSSKLHRLAPGNLHSICPPQSTGAGYWDYALSKACQLLHAVYLNWKFEGTERRAFAVEPGLVHTSIMRESSSIMRWMNYFFLRPILKDADQGVATTLYCLLAPKDRLDPLYFYYNDCSPESPGSHGSLEEAIALQNKFAS